MIRTTTFDERIVYGIVVVAAVLSYSTLAGLAARAGYSTPMAWSWPIVVEVLALMAARAATRLRVGRGYAQGLLVAQTSISVAAAAASRLLPAGPLPGWAAALVAVIPPLCVLAAPHLAVQMRRDAVDASGASTADAPAVDVPEPDAAPADDAPTRVEARDAEGASDALTDDADHTAIDAPCVTSPDQPRRSMTHDTPAPADVPDALLFDLTAAPRRTRRGSVTDEQRAGVLRLAATTDMSGREIADAEGVSEPTVRRIIRDAGGRDALQADGAPALVAVGASG